MVGFSLVCSKRQFKSYGKIDQGVKLRDTGELACPVAVRFKWNEDKKKFVRSKRICMHHTHQLDITERQNISNKNIQSEIQLYVECKIPVTHIH